MSRTLASATPGPDIVPKSGSDGKIAQGFLPDSSRALFFGLMSAVPTQSLTGFSTWVNQGSATVAETEAGLTLYAPSRSGDSINMLVKEPPSTPYSITVLLQPFLKLNVSYPSVEFGFRDSSTGKLCTFHWNSQGSAPYQSFNVSTWSSYTTWVESLASFLHFSPFMWLGVADDGTTVYFKLCPDGKSWQTLYSIAKASGYLGSSGYNQIVFGINGCNFWARATILSYAEA